MSNDPLLSPKILTDSDEAGDADYEAIYAEVAATERGRRFLIEYASRNHRADTLMLAEALARLEAAMRGDTSWDSAALSSAVAALAAVIGRFEAEAARAAEPASLAAAERIQDIAFALREREADASLCDALDAAVREMGDVLARNDAAAERARGAAALLRDLAGRINAMIAVAVTHAGEEQQAVVVEDAIAPAAAELEVATAHEAAEGGEEFGEDQAFEEHQTPSELSEAEVQIEPVTAAHEQAAAPADGLLDTAGAAVVAQAQPVEAGAQFEAFEPWAVEVSAADSEKQERRQESGESGLKVDVAGADGPPTNSLVRDEEGASAKEVLAITIEAEDMSPAENDPLHQPPSTESPSPASLPAPAAGPMHAPPPANMAAATRPLLWPAANDPLAAVRALGEEELIALFS